LFVRGGSRARSNARDAKKRVRVRLKKRPARCEGE